MVGVVPNLLLDSGYPLAYPIYADAPGVPSAPYPEDHDASVRVVIRSLTVMQKEAVVVRSGSPYAWRMSSDEGPYLQGHDQAPAPLAFLTTGMAADLLARVAESFGSLEIDTEAVHLTLETWFSMEGSLPGGTMVGGADPPDITIHVPTTDRSTATGTVLTGVMASAAAGLMGPQLTSRFSLTADGIPASVGRVAPLDEAPPAGAGPPPPPLAGSDDLSIITKVIDIGSATDDAGVGLEKEQRRGLHLRADATYRSDGLIQVETTIHQPVGSTFRFLADEPLEGQPGDRAPDAFSYISAGIGFCYMTQLGRYAKITRRSLGGYHIVQDTRLSVGDPTADPPRGGAADGPRTHVFLDPGGDVAFARQAVDMGEQTCFVHALCRTPLRPKVRLLTPG